MTDAFGKGPKNRIQRRQHILSLEKFSIVIFVTSKPLFNVHKLLHMTSFNMADLLG
jgi:hypothetical protein